MALIAADIRPGQRVLDAGCGRGEMVAHLCSKGMDAYGIDYSSDAIKLAKSSGFPDRFTCDSVTTAALGAHSVDRALLLGTIEHLYDDEVQKALANLHQALKSGGRLVITTCTNRLYHKVLTYQLRRTVIRFLKRLGLPLRDPTPVRSGEDMDMHVNEQHYFSLSKHLRNFSWSFEVRPLPNLKYLRDDLYRESKGDGVPLKRRGRWRRWLNSVVFRFPLNLFLARSYLVIAARP